MKLSTQTTIKNLVSRMSPTDKDEFLRGYNNSLERMCQFDRHFEFASLVDLLTDWIDYDEFEEEGNLSYAIGGLLAFLTD